MYIAIVFVTLFVVSHVSGKDGAIEQKMKASAMQCMQEHSISMGEIEQLKQKQIPDNTKCFLECVYKKLHMFNDQGMFDAEGVKKMSAEYFGNDDAKNQQAQAFIDDCSSVNNEQVDSCSRAALLHKCVIDKAPQYGLSQ